MNAPKVSETFLAAIISTWPIDSAYVYFVMPMGAIGLILCCISFGVLMKLNDPLIIFNYFKVIAINSALLCIVIFLDFFTFTPRYFYYYLSEFSRYYRCEYNTVACYVLVMYSNLLNIMLDLERMANFEPRIRSWPLGWRRPYFTCAILFCLSFVVNLPTLFIFNSRSEADFAQAIANVSYAAKFIYCKHTPFSTTQLGIGILSLVLALRDITPLIIEILVTIASIVYLKRFVDKKAVMLGSSDSSTDSLQFRLTLMTITLSVLSILTSISCFLVNLFYILQSLNAIYHLLLPVSIGLKQSTFFFFLYFFNRKFSDCVNSGLLALFGGKRTKKNDRSRIEPSSTSLHQLTTFKPRLTEN